MEEAGGGVEMGALARKSIHLRAETPPAMLSCCANFVQITGRDTKMHLKSRTGWLFPGQAGGQWAGGLLECSV